MKNKFLKVLAKASEKSVVAACNSKSAVVFYEPEMPKALKAKKLKN